MKTFDIFLTNGASVRVKADGMERKALGVACVDGPQIVFTAGGGIVAQFVAKAVLGVVEGSASTAGEATN